MVLQKYLQKLQEKKKLITYITLLLSIITTSTLSYYLHTPRENPPLNNTGLMYNDIVYGLFNPIFRDIITSSGTPDRSNIDKRWFNSDVAIKLATSERLCPVPYIDYKFEYPPIVGLVWFATTCISINLVLPSRYSGIEYHKLSEEIGRIHYDLQSVILITFLVVTSIYMYKIVSVHGPSFKRVMLFVLLPSTILYTIYNWDIIAAAFMIMALYYLINKKYLVSGLLLGLSISTKLLPIIFAFILIYDLIQKYRSNNAFYHELIQLSKGIILTGLAPYILMMIVSYNGFTYFIEHHSQWYCENCVYAFITRDIWSPYNRVYSIISVAIFTLIAASINLDIDTPKDIITIALISIIISTALNYVFSPQMMIIVSSIAILILSLRQLLFLVIADLANFGIMFLFFKDQEIRSWLNQHLALNIRLEFSPHTPDSLVQLAALVRNVILILIMIDCLYTLAKSKTHSFH